MKQLKLYQKVLAGLLTALGFAACTTEQPDLYGPMPVLYGPPIVDSTEVQPDSRSVPEEGIETPNLETNNEKRHSSDEPA